MSDTSDTPRPPADLRLDPDVRAYLEEQAALSAPPIWEVPLERVRAGDRETYAVDEPTPVGEVIDHDIAGPGGRLPLRIYRPDAAVAGPAPYGVVMLFHGGGFVLGDLETHDEAARRTCIGADAVVVSVDYRLAPEHRFPAAVDDAEAATLWAAESIEEFGGDPDRLIVSGDSAGGNLAAVVARRLRDAGGPDVVGQALIYPVTDMRSGDHHASRSTFAEGFGLSEEAMDWFGRQYLARDADMHHPDASPIVVDDLRGLPPAFVLTAEFDPLRDEGDAYAERLRAAGVEVEHHRLEGTIHGVMSNPVGFRSGDELWRRLDAWTRARLRPR